MVALMLQCSDFRTSVVPSYFVNVYALWLNEHHIEANRKWSIENRMVTWPMTSRDSNTIRVQYFENSWRCYIATIANYKTVYAVRYSTVGYPSELEFGFLLTLC